MIYFSYVVQMNKFSLKLKKKDTLNSVYLLNVLKTRLSYSNP